MKRITAIVLTLLLLLTLLPAAASADDLLYVSVGGEYFTELDQTLSIGGGTAKLRWSGYDLILEMNNVKLQSDFDDLGVDEDGLQYYAGIVYEGSECLYVRCTNCSITAPAHGEDVCYEGIYAVGPISLSGSLTVSNVDIGADADDFRIDGGRVSIQSVGGPAIWAEDVALHASFGESVSLETRGISTVICDSFYVNDGIGYDAANKAKFNVSLRYDERYGYADTGAILCTGGATVDGDLSVSVNADLSGCPAEYPLLVTGLMVGEQCRVNDRLSCNMDVKGHENLAVGGLFTDSLNQCGAIKAELKLTGDHRVAGGILATSLWYSDENATYYASITGAKADDSAIGIEEGDCEFMAKEVCALTDCPDAMALYLPFRLFFVDAPFGDALNIHEPKGGTWGNTSVTDENGTMKYGTVLTPDGKPASRIICNGWGYVFHDIDDNSTDPYRKAILWAVDSGITTGFTPIEFRPGAQCTRGQVVTFLWRANGSPEPRTKTNPFVDVDQSSPYYKAILWAYESGITTGFDATHFRPSNACTRAQVVTFLWRADGKPTAQSSQNPFKDVSKTGGTAPYYNAILWAAGAGITTGYSDGSFRPNAVCNRGQIVTFIYRDTAAQVEGKISSVRFELNPRDLPQTAKEFVGDYLISGDRGKKWTTIPVAVTAVYSTGTEKTLYCRLSYYNENGDFTPPADWLSCIGFGLTQSTACIRCEDGKETMLLSFNFDESTVSLVSDRGYDLQHNDKFAVFFEGGYDLWAYNMQNGQKTWIMLAPSVITYVKDFVLSGNTVYYLDTDWPGAVDGQDLRTVCLYSSDLTQSKPTTGRSYYETYSTKLAEHKNVISASIEANGYTVTLQDGSVQHYNF